MSTTPDHSILTPELHLALTKDCYFNLKVIDGKIVGLRQYAFTGAIMIGLSATSHERRYCYEHLAEAFVALEEYTNTDEHPTGDWIVCKGVYRGQFIDYWNPESSKYDPKKAGQ